MATPSASSSSRAGDPGPQSSAYARARVLQSTPAFGPGRGKGSGGLGKGFGMKRHRKILRDNIKGITKGSIRRLARRGGVKRISAGIYDEIRGVIKSRLTEILQQCSIIAEHRLHKTVTALDVIFVLNRLGTPIYGFESRQKP
ncbi:uncharacterized protein PV09_06791 [Verruconis gallopava]|uniref:Histone H4 n=1 Tax=Verruconis gallopava TaxID=253628 RepID=A0A0D2AS00_9PEZI|nr:uncharacterized protein PV09_06791 [Verruconis gallopava]KIW01954.1 hypothetical protein PV09_06791 [Verruconis gallopava]